LFFYGGNGAHSNSLFVPGWWPLSGVLGHAGAAVLSYTLEKV